MEEPFMKEYMETSTAFKGTSSDIQNYLIESVSIAINEKYCNEISLADFVFVQTDEIIDVSVKTKLSVIVCCVMD